MPAKLQLWRILVHLALHRSRPIRREQDVAETAAFRVERHDDDRFATAERGLAALRIGETVAARSGLVQLVLHGPCVVGCEEQVFLGLLGHCARCQNKQGQGYRDRRLELAQGIPSFKGTRCAESSTAWGQAARIKAARSNLGASETLGEDPNGRPGGGLCRGPRTPFLALPLRASTSQQFQERGRSCRPCRSRSSRSRIAIRLVPRRAASRRTPRPDDRSGDVVVSEPCRQGGGRCWNARGSGSAPYVHPTRADATEAEPGVRS